ncbi:spidroin-2-like [Schistocerca americana]|uniref:spidroin-2-like n=1 Tax=Schistocerca americana TaxID=7009 RepID=UPI001F4F43D0|nr:spidroin-2-like [Schistocerca americana]
MARELRPGSTACITHKHTPQYSGGGGAAPAACPCVHAARRASARDWRQQRRLHPSAGTGRSALGISVECCGSWQLASGEGKWDEASAKAALQQDGPGGRARGCSQPAIFAAAAAAAAAEAEAAAARDAGPAVRGPASSEHGLQRRARRSLSSYGGAGGRGRGTGGGGGGGGPVAARRRRRHAPGPLPLPAHTRADRRVRAATRAHTRGRTSAEEAAVAAAARQTPAGRWAREEPGAAALRARRVINTAPEASRRRHLKTFGPLQPAVVGIMSDAVRKPPTELDAAHARLGKDEKRERKLRVVVGGDR